MAHLRTVNMHLRLVVDQISEGAMILEAAPLEAPGPRVVFLNRGLCRLVGRRAEDLLGQPLAQLFEAERLAGFLSLLPRVAAAGKAFLTRAYLQGEPPDRKFCRWTVSCIRSPDGTPLNFIITVAEEPVGGPARSGGEAGEVLGGADETHLHEMARLESLEVIASGIAHDFRNDLTAVMLNVSNAASVTQHPDRQREFLIDAAGSAQHAKELAD
jgi:signal transduction histidine kinase